MITSFYNKKELEKIGFKNLGKKVLISRFARIYAPEKISIGNNCRIDDFCILSGNITIGNNIHISAGVYLFAGDAGIVIEDYVAISSRCSVYAITDDYSGNYLTNSTIDIEFRNVISGLVHIKKHAIIGSGSTILPNVVIGVGTAIGSMSLVNKNLDEWKIYVGIPCKFLKKRAKTLLKLEQEFAKK